MQFNNWRLPANSTKVATARTAGGTTLSVTPGDGVKFGTPSSTEPIPLVILRQKDQPNQAVALLAHDISTDDVTVSVPTGPDSVNFPDADLAVGDLVIVGAATASYMQLLKLS